MYSDSQEPSRPERPRSSGRGWKNALTTIAVFGFLVAAAYAIGGRSVMRRLLQARSRATAVLQPPTPAEMQRATDAAVRDSVAREEAAQRGPAPATPAFILTMVGGILVVAVAMFYITGRRRPGDARTH